MPDLWMDVDTALSEVPVNLLPLISDADFKTRVTAAAYNAPGMGLVWNFITTGGAFTQTAVTPTTGGNYDWTHQGDGMYTIEIPASGGASINNDTEGFGWFTGYMTGVLPFRGPVIGFRAAALNNALIDGGDLLDVNVTHVGDTPQTANDNGADINAILADTNELQTDWVSGGRLDLILDARASQTSVDGLPTNAELATALAAADDATLAAIAALNDLSAADVNAEVGAALADIHLDRLLAVDYDPANKPGVATALLNELIGNDGGVSQFTANALELGPGGGSAPTAAQVADAVWDEVLSGHLVAGSTGAALNSAAAGSSLGAGAIEHTVNVDDGSNPLDGVEVWVTTDTAGNNVVAYGVTDALGEIAFMLDAGTYYVWKQLAGYSFTNPESITVS